MALLLLVLPATGVADAESAPLFSAEGMGVLGASSPRLRSRAPRMDLGQLASARLAAQRNRPTKVQLNLFADADFEVLFERTHPTPSGYALTGRVQGDPFSTVAFAVNGDVASGMVWTSEGIYGVNSFGEGAVVRQLDQFNMGRCAAAPALANEGLPLSGASVVKPPKAGGDGAHSEIHTIQPAAVGATDEGDVIDLMVVYPSYVRRNAGGQELMRTLIDRDVVMANEAFRVSFAALQIRLVAAFEVVDPPDYDRINTVNRLQNDSDGRMDEVHALRDSYAADIVFMHLGEDHSTLPFDPIAGFGAGFLLASLSPTEAAEWGFGFGPSYALAHEVGHNMGLLHDRADVFRVDAPFDYSLEALFPYSYGYLLPSAEQFATIMAVGGSPIPRFSNPNQKYPDDSGVPLGVPGDQWTRRLNGPADAVRTLNQTLHVVRTFGQAPPVAPMAYPRPLYCRRPAASSGSA